MIFIIESFTSHPVFCIMNLIADKKLIVSRWINLSLFWFLIVAMMGLLLRYITNRTVEGLIFGNILHAHSHLAFLGWIYSGLYALLVYYFIDEKKLKFYNDLFWFSQIAVIGMIISFWMQAYGLFSITFSSLHMLLGYIFVFRFYKDTRTVKRDASFLFSFSALILMIISTLGPWTLGIMGAMKAGTKQIMDLLINFYLHFQYNGWFIFALTGILFLILKDILNERKLKNYFHLMIASILPAYALSAVWEIQNEAVYIIATSAALVQLIALYILLKEIYIKRKLINKKFKLPSGIITVVLISFVLKNSFQLISAHPDAAVIISKIRLLVVAYLHMVLLGVCSSFILIAYLLTGFLKENNFLKAGFMVFISGFVITELMMFVQVWYYLNKWGNVENFNQWLFYASILLPAAVGVIFLSSILNSSSQRKSAKTIKIISKSHVHSL